MTLVNLTPHPIRVYEVGTPPQIEDVDAGLLAVIPPSGTLARLATIDLGTWGSALTGDGHGVPVEGVEYGHPEGLPPKAGEDRYIVSLAFALAMHHREDVLVPYGEVRNMAGTIVGCTAFARVAG